MHVDQTWFGAKYNEPIMTFCWLNPWEQLEMPGFMIEWADGGLAQRFGRGCYLYSLWHSSWWGIFDQDVFSVLSMLAAFDLTNNCRRKVLGMGLLPDMQNIWLRMHRECRERFPLDRGLAIPICITARALRTCCDECRDRQLADFFEVGGGENVPGIHGACATRNSTYLVGGPC